MMNPVATYRFQFHEAFTFDDFQKCIPYLRQLGIVTVYASPIFAAVPGSTHGYDGLHPHKINPEIGTEEQLRNITNELHAGGMQWLQDIVPNHMAFHPSNEWLMDVLEKGTQSVYAGYFDILWDHPSGKLMVPFLGGTLEEILEKNELELKWTGGQLVLQYFDTAYPVHPQTYATVLSTIDTNDHVVQLLAQMQALKETAEKHAYAGGWKEWQMQFAALWNEEQIASLLEARLAAINSEELAGIVDEQVYRPCYWKEADTQMNYRRFFTVNGLVCMNIQDPHVFDHYHELIGKLVRDGVFNGLRIDHIDGLYDPTDYLERLRALAGNHTFITVEKILEASEQLPHYWPVEGNTGYDFLAVVNNLLTNEAAAPLFTQFYYGLANDQRTVQQQVRDSKAMILSGHMAGELDNLLRLFISLDLATQDELSALGEQEMKNALAAFLVHCPVYRFYSNLLPMIKEEARAVQEVLDRIRQEDPSLHAGIHLLEQAWMIHPCAGDEAYNLRAVHFFKRCMQFTGPLMAKGVEDTLMYTFNRFIAHNEVGDAADAFGTSVHNFHQKMKQRQEHQQLSLNATATHDTKRGEDVRARLNVLTDIPGEWLACVKEWMDLNAGLKMEQAPDPTDEYFIYQVLIGSYPMPGTEDPGYAERLSAYLEKALREAKRHSNWSEPNESYEAAVKTFATRLLDEGTRFRDAFAALHVKVAGYGVINSLVQLALKCTCPGVPDIYQGCELWDFSHVDPDNRRPVDFEKRNEILLSFGGKDEKSLIRELWQHRFDGRIKLWLLHRLLQLRKEKRLLFSEGDYIPLEITGSLKDHVLAFARVYGDEWLVVIVPLRLAASGGAATMDSIDWKDTSVTLPFNDTIQWKENIHGKQEAAKGSVAVAGLLQHLPLALLSFKKETVKNNRGAGVLLPVSSLPSLYGTGDMGEEARRFADFLLQGKQQYWQVLPINPVDAGQGFSPYSSLSAFAGNTLFISPGELVQDGWIASQDINDTITPAVKADFPAAAALREKLLKKAWSSFSSGHPLHAAFIHFYKEHLHWLHDYALYSLLKAHHGGAPWYEWPDAFKNRDGAALHAFARKYEGELAQVYFGQFLFERQWQALRSYCSDRGVRLIGDLPFYVSYDSADVWASPQFFKLDKAGNRLGIAGVPPDAFSADGQLWGMPVFDWEALQKDGYKWWIRRLKRNMELFDLVRLDHFRAFASYWEVPANAVTAKEGVWVKGPGHAFFEAIHQALGSLPFVAEDLGDIDDEVLALRDAFGLPGMKVLQFAFSEEDGRSPHLPHHHAANFFVYTGTHDNNTTKGWYLHETDESTRANIAAYLGCEPPEDEIASAFAQVAYASVGQTVIVPMQDLLALDESARINTPAAGSGNWTWRMLPGQRLDVAVKKLRTWTKRFNRRSR